MSVTRGGQRLSWLLLAAVLMVGRTALRAGPGRGSSRRRSTGCVTASFADKEAIAERLIASGHAGAQPVLTALLEDRLFVRDQDRLLVIVKSATRACRPTTLIDPLTLAEAGSAPPDQLTKIGTNNRLRRVLRTTLSRFALANPDAAVRLAAVKEMMRSLDDTDRGAAASAGRRRKPTPASRSRSTPAWRWPRSTAPTSARGSRRSRRCRAD